MDAVVCLNDEAEEVEVELTMRCFGGCGDDEGLDDDDAMEERPVGGGISRVSSPRNARADDELTLEDAPTSFMYAGASSPLAEVVSFASRSLPLERIAFRRASARA